ncbi:MAG: hypothetical protein GXZ19_06495 [Bacteroidales bacterium]|nr:hypothetical protein [Bacteroidales bacterium]
MTTDIQHLIDKYFDGESSAEEEKILRRSFTQEDLPEELKVYASLFHFLDDEATALAILNEIRSEEKRPARRSLLSLRNLRTIAAVAATLLIAVLLLTRPDRKPALTGSYVWVDGKQITDPATVRKYAEASFGKIQPESDIIEDQLRFILE